MAEPLQKIIANRYGGRNLPVTLVLPDGGRVPLSSDPEIEILARTWRGLKALAAPAMGALARAYVHNDIDFTGSARRAMAIAEAHGRRRSRTAATRSRRAGGSGGTSVAATARTSRYHYDVSNAFYRLWLDSQLVYSCAYFSDRRRHARRRAGGQARPHLPQAAPCARRALPRHRLRLGRAAVPRGGALRRRGDRHHAVEEPVRPRPTSEIAARGLAGRVRVELRDYLDLPEDALYDKIASVGMFEHVGIARFPQYFGKIRRILKPGGLVLNHGITHNPLGAQSLGSGIGDFVEEYVFPGGELAHVSRR